MKSKYLVGAGLGLAALFLFSRRASAAKAGGEVLEASTDRIVDSIPGASSAPQTGQRKAGGGGVLPPVIQATGQVASGVVGVIEAGARQIGRFFGTVSRADTLGG